MDSKMTRRNRSEQRDQRAAIEHLAWRARPGAFFFHIPLGGFRTRVEGAILKAIGTIAGIPDLMWRSHSSSSGGCCAPMSQIKSQVPSFAACGKASGAHSPQTGEPKP
jgi:hypothetical protein